MSLPPKPVFVTPPPVPPLQKLNPSIASAPSTTTTTPPTTMVPPVLPIPIPVPSVPPPVPPPVLPRPSPPVSSASATVTSATTVKAAMDNTTEYDVSEESKRAREKQEQLVQKILMKRRANALAVPTNDAAVRSRLRSLNEPVTLFGEREMERRERLREIMAKLDADGELDNLLQTSTAFGAADDAASEEEEMEGVQASPFYTVGPNELLKARTDILNFSLPRAAARIARAKRKREDPDEDEDAELATVLQRMFQMTMVYSEIGDDRPLSACALSPDGTHLATCGWSGITKIWTVPDMKRLMAMRVHNERVTSVAFSPTDNVLATASADRTAILWDFQGSAIRKFEGHLDRLARLAFHPSGAYLGTASFDKTWRLWDVNTGIELLLQEGHSRSVYGIAFQGDGALAATCGLDALARVWDMRTGRSILALEGHVKPVLGIDFSPNGFHLATGSEDHTCRVWDLRKRQSLYIIPAHNSLISQVKYEPMEGYVLATASYDNTCRVWSGRDFKPVKTLAGHEGKVMGLDVAGDGQSIVSVSYDRTIKLWANNN